MQERTERGQFLFLRYLVRNLFNGALHIRGRCNGNGDRMVEKLLREARKPVRHCRRKERGLSRVRRSCQYLFNCWRETTIQHLVCLVQHAHPQLAQRQSAAIEMVLHPSWCADDHLRAIPQRGELLAIGSSTYQNCPRKPPPTCPPPHHPLSLDRHLARWHQHHHHPD